LLEEDLKDIEVKVEVLQLIKESTIPLFYRLEELLRDHYTKTYEQADLSLTFLIEYSSATRILLQCLNKYIDIALDSNLSAVPIPFEDFTIITHTSQVIEQGYRSRVGYVPLWIH